MNKTKIAWCDYTWNPVSGCTKVSEGCRNCYAASIAKRFWGERRFSDVICHEDKLNEPLKVKKPARVFVNSMSDLFHPDVSYDFAIDVFYRMALFNRNTYIVLTKRPERMIEFFKKWDDAIMVWQSIGRPYFKFPLRNVWLGVSIENQQTADERIPLLLQTEAAVRFVSYEPALGPVDFYKACGLDSHIAPQFSWIKGNGIDWVIMGCESGPKRRPMSLDWARSMRDQCQDANVTFFVIQMEIVGKVVVEPELDGKKWLQFPGGKGGMKCV